MPTSEAFLVKGLSHTRVHKYMNTIHVCKHAHNHTHIHLHAITHIHILCTYTHKDIDTQPPLCILQRSGGVGGRPDPQGLGGRERWVQRHDPEGSQAPHDDPLFLHPSPVRGQVLRQGKTVRGFGLG